MKVPGRRQRPNSRSARLAVALSCTSWQGLVPGPFRHQPLSAVLSGRASATSPDPWDKTVQTRLEPQMLTSAITEAAVLSIAAYFGAIEHYAMLYGRDRTHLEAERLSAIASIRALHRAVGSPTVHQ